MNEYFYIIKGIMSEAAEEEKEHYDKGYNVTKSILSDSEEISRLKTMGVIVALVESGVLEGN